MRLLIIRHGDPDYELDSLTPAGEREAELLARRLQKIDVAAFYSSPLGRARRTAEPALRLSGREAEVLPWLVEFEPKIIDVQTGERRIAWDWLPVDWTGESLFYDKDRWHTHPVMREADAKRHVDRVAEGLDALLLRHGYQREHNVYRAVSPNRDTIVLFCHFGVECVILSHLLGISPMTLWHGFCALPTSVSTLITEERREGVAYFRVNSFGDASHLLEAGVEPSFSARFCETYDDMSERHD